MQSRENRFIIVSFPPLCKSSFRLRDSTTEGMKEIGRDSYQGSSTGASKDPPKQSLECRAEKRTNLRIQSQRETSAGWISHLSETKGKKTQ